MDRRTYRTPYTTCEEIGGGEIMNLWIHKKLRYQMVTTMVPSDEYKRRLL